MTTIGVDIEQFVVDPYGSGIQRVLQYLAKEWPVELADGVFVIPQNDEFLLLDPSAAAELIGLAFAPGRNDDLRIDVNAWLKQMDAANRRVQAEELTQRIHSWLLPEVSYLPSVLARFEYMAERMPTAMIGYDALPMTEPANYRFPPGVAANASEYFRLLASTDALVCISDYSREEITKRLHRDPHLVTTVAHPGGDHVPAVSEPQTRREGPVHFLRIGTMESRKMPLEILRAFLSVRESGVDARLTFVGGKSSSYEWMNEEVLAATRTDVGFRWITRASDADVAEMMNECDAFLSFGTEGYGIPVLEAARRGIPVLFGGVQPAAELMLSRGAIDCGTASQGSIQDAFERFSSPEEVLNVAATVNPGAVPTWSEFSRRVVEAVLAQK